jgi:hypothetical protein
MGLDCNQSATQRDETGWYCTGETNTETLQFIDHPAPVGTGWDGCDETKDLVGCVAPWRFESSLRHRKTPASTGVLSFLDSEQVFGRWSECNSSPTQPGLAEECRNPFRGVAVHSRHDVAVRIQRHVDARVTQALLHSLRVNVVGECDGRPPHLVEPTTSTGPPNGRSETRPRSCRGFLGRPQG